jgi:transcriptional/translational regulatory protein YebC/TACO1
MEALKKANLQPTTAEVAMIPQNYIKLEGPVATQMIRLVEALDEHDDVQHVYSNFDVDQKLLEEVAS